MGLQPLEFSECLTDSPAFREKLHDHEKELERTSKAIKSIIHHGKQVCEAAKQLSRAQRAFAQDLKEYNYESTVSQQTDDEMVIADAFGEFARLIEDLESQRDKLLHIILDGFIKPLERFRKENIGAAKEEKKMFEKQTAKFCQSQERYLNLKTTKVTESTLQEADASLEMERRGFYRASMKYVLKLQEVEEKKKFEFVELLLSHMYSWITFYHEGHTMAGDFFPFMKELQIRLQKIRENFDCTKDQAEQLMNKMLEVRGTKPMDHAGTGKGYTRQGYLYLMEKKALGTGWTKYYCQYRKETREFTMILYNQMGGKMNLPETHFLESCTRRASDSIEKRFCFDLSFKEKSGTYTFQALSEEDRKLWLEAMDGKEPVYIAPKAKTEDIFLDDIGFTFMKKAIATIEARGLEDEGLYRVVGVNSKVTKLTQMGLDRRKVEKLNLDDPTVWETKTITSGVKNYLRSLPEPLMTFRLHDQFVKAAKQEGKTLRMLDTHKLVYQLPDSNFDMLKLLIEHLKRVSEHSEKNMMTVANLGVCFGPTLMRPEEETVAAIMDIKFCNIIVEILISHYDKIFNSWPEDANMAEIRGTPSVGLAGARNASSSSVSGSTSSLVSGPGPRPVSASTPLPSSQEAPSIAPSPIYANQAPVHPSATAARSKLRPVQIFNPSTGGFETHSSTSSSSESLNSGKSVQPRGPSATSSPHSTPSSAEASRRGSASSTQHTYSNVSAKVNKFNFAGMSCSDTPAFGSVKKRGSNDYGGSSSMNSSMHNSMTGSVTGASATALKTSPKGKTVRTLYPCRGENDTELSFEPNVLIYNVRPSKEPGWLEGVLNGKTGLVPDNYVEFID